MPTTSKFLRTVTCKASLQLTDLHSPPELPPPFCEAVFPNAGLLCSPSALGYEKPAFGWCLNVLARHTSTSSISPRCGASPALFPSCLLCTHVCPPAKGATLSRSSGSQWRLPRSASVSVHRLGPAHLPSRLPWAKRIIHSSGCPAHGPCHCPPAD